MLAQSQPDRYNPCKATTAPLFLLQVGLPAPALIMSLLLPLCLRPLVVILKSLLIVGLLALFLCITLWNPIPAVCACAAYFSVADQCTVFPHACVNRVKSHPAIASTFPYMNNIILNYLRPNLFCFNFPVEKKNTCPGRGKAVHRGSAGLPIVDIIDVWKWWNRASLGTCKLWIEFPVTVPWSCPAGVWWMLTVSGCHFMYLWSS